MTYAVNEMFYTLQGEGRNAGRAAVFCRFAGCNMWSGREADRAAAACWFCDTDFVGTAGEGGGKFQAADELAAAMAGKWPAPGRKFCVLTGGEPALQVDGALIDALHAVGFEVAIETNGTIPLPHGIDWICVSPKRGAALAVTSGDELKFVWPQAGMEPAEFEPLDFAHWLIQPMYGAGENSGAVEFCLQNPRWRLCNQQHKWMGIR